MTDGETDRWRDKHTQIDGKNGNGNGNGLIFI